MLDKNGNKEQGQQIANSSRHNKYQSNYINNHLNANGLNVPIKRQILSQWIKKQDPTICIYDKLTLNKFKKCMYIKVSE